MLLVHQGGEQRLVTASLEDIQRVGDNERVISRRGSIDPMLSSDPVGLAKVGKFGVMWS